MDDRFLFVTLCGVLLAGFLGSFSTGYGVLEKYDCEDYALAVSAFVENRDWYDVNGDGVFNEEDLQVLYDSVREIDCVQEHTCITVGSEYVINGHKLACVRSIDGVSKLHLIGLR